MAVTYETNTEGLETTQYYGLYKPGYEDVADINVLNENADIIDAILHDHESLMDDITERTIDGVLLSRDYDIQHYAVCSTDAGNAAKSVNLTNFRLREGSLVFVKFSNTNTADNPTLNVNNTGAKIIQYREAAITAGRLAANRTYAFVYDGVNYQLIGDLDTIYSNFVGSGDNAAAGLVPSPGNTAGNSKYLREDGNWIIPPDTDTHYTSHMYAGSGTAANAATTNGNTKITLADNSTVRNTVTIKGSGATTVTSDANGNITINSTDNNTTYSAATQSANGLMSAADKKKLDGIATGANAYTHPTTAGNKHIPAGGSSGQILRWSAAGTAAWGADNNTTYSVATQSANGLMSAADKKKLDGITAGATPDISAASVAASGYIKFRNGLIIQWGVQTAPTTETSYSVTFPVSFAQACYSMNVSTDLSTHGTSVPYALANIHPQVLSVSKTGATLFSQHSQDSTNQASRAYWMAIGK